MPPPTTVTAFTAARMLAIEGASVVSGTVDVNGHLILTRYNGTSFDAGVIFAALPAASETVSGVLELATLVEVQTGTDTLRAVTPYTLANAIASLLPSASDTVKGAVELATTAETQTGTDATRAVTPAGLSGALSSLLPDATTTAKGISELATTLETQTGTDATRTVTPSGLAGALPNMLPVASTTVSGIVELATNLETQTGTDTTRAVTPAGLSSAISGLNYASPIGSVALYAGLTVPSGWLECNGQAVSRTTYANLYNAIGTLYGAGDGNTTFNLPNLKGRVPIGYDSGQTEFNAFGNTGGAKTNTHNHYTSWSWDGNSFYSRLYSDAARSRVVTGPVTRGMGGLTSSSGGTREDSTYDETITTLPPYLVMSFIIRF